MGGNALRNCYTRRYSAGEYYELAAHILNVLTSMFPETKVEVIPAYRTKENFGDMDVLIESNGLPSDYIERIKTVFKPLEMIKNGNVLSFEYEELQIDLIVTPEEEFETSAHYFAYNDLGNLCGRLAHMMGVKLGHDGLSYHWRINNTEHFKTEIISQSWAEILPVLGLDYARYLQGFDTLEDIFKFVASSRFFHKDIFFLHNRNNTSRTRDRKRKTYMEFLKWLETYEETPEQSFWKQAVAAQKFKGDKTFWLPYLFANIAGFEDTYKRVQTEWNLAIEFKKRYNGDLVKTWTGLEGKELGKFMQWMRKEYGDARLKEDVLKMNSELVEGWVGYFFEKWEKQNGNS